MNSFASKKREISKTKIFAITGSAGKTSLKNMIKDLLQIYGETISSPKSFNNHYGVPLSLSQLSIKHKYGVFEVGMSKQGEIKKLTNLIKPQIGIITNIGEAHIENFRNLKGIADAKGEMIDNIQKYGTLILNRDDKYFQYLRKKAKLKNLKIISFGFSKKSDVHPISIIKKNNRKILNIKIKNQNLRLNIKNINIFNVLSSLALLKELNLNLNKVTNYYQNCEPSEGRGKIFNVKRYRKNFKLIDESYNANPLSVKNAIENLNSIKKQNFKNTYYLEICLNWVKNRSLYIKIYQKLLTIQILIKCL